MNENLDLYKQNTDLEILQTLIPHLKSPTFIDIGAEKGTFTKHLSERGLKGIFFEPLPQFAEELILIAQNTGCTFSSYAIDSMDREADFYAASDLSDNPMEYFSTLHPLQHDSRIQHKKVAKVTCRSLNSLLQEGVVKNNLGIIKIDTEGNDLNVLQGMGEVSAEILMCEFFMPGIYAGWQLGHPLGLIEEARKLGFNNFIAIKRLDEFEMTSINNPEFVDKQWGNIIFTKDDIFQSAKCSLEKIIQIKEAILFRVISEQTTLMRNEIASLDSVRKELISTQSYLKLKTARLKSRITNFCKSYFN
jgi:FkbM family methyltransferase